MQSVLNRYSGATPSNPILGYESVSTNFSRRFFRLDQLTGALDRLTAGRSTVSGPISTFWSRYQHSAKFEKFTTSCDTTFTENCDPSRAYTNIAGVYSIKASAVIVTQLL
jgi:hypothetical protein